MWTISEKRYTSDEGESYTGYGVAFGECMVENVTTDHEAIDRFVDKLNKYEASPVHIYDLIEDFLAEVC